LSFVIAFIIFSLIILIHELGHFLLAKKNGIRVTEFSMGMGPRIISTVKGETRYSLKLFPFGGSCAMGEDDDDVSEGSFKSKSVWARMSVIAAGPIFNFILAFILSIIVIGSMGIDKAQVMEIVPDSAAEKAGLQVGDVITKVNGRKINISRELVLYLFLHQDKIDNMDLTVKRDGATEKITYQSDKIEKYMMGLSVADSSSSEGVEVVKLSRGQAIEKSGITTGDYITKMNDTIISSSDDFWKYLEDNPLSDETIRVTYNHKGKSNTVEITPSMTTLYDPGFGYNVGREKVSPLGVIRYSLADVKYVISSTFENLGMLATGKLSVNDLSGPVGVVDMIGSTYEETKSEGQMITWMTMLMLAILLSANLGVMNLLPLPALDGGRLVFLIIELVRGKPIKPEKEGIVHFVGFVLLMVLMVFVLFNDIRRIF
jgi:regulator of sigma E protease